MEIEFTLDTWQVPDGQWIWYTEALIWGHERPDAAPTQLGIITESIDDSEYWVVNLYDHSIADQEYQGMEAAQQAVLDHYAQLSPLSQPAAAAVQPA